MKHVHRRRDSAKSLYRSAVFAMAIGAASSAARATDSTAAYWTGASGSGKWEDAGNWTVDPTGSVQSDPPASSTVNGVRIGTLGNPAATGTFDSATMNWYVTNGGVAPGAAVNMGSIVIGADNGSPGTLNFTAGDLSVGSFYIGGWPNTIAATGTLLMSGGTIDVTGSLTVGNEDSATPSHGTIAMTGGQIDYGSQTISIGNRESTGAVFLSGGSFNGTGVVTIGGSTLGTGSTATSVGVGSLNISGSGEFLAGNIQFNSGRPNKTVLSLNDSLSISGGTLSVGSIGQNTGSANLVCTFSFTGGTVTANTFRMSLNQQGGTLSPGAGGADNGGASIGSITLLDDSIGKQSGAANYTQAAGAHLLLDVGSGTSDVVHLETNGVTGFALTATLNGEIDVNAVGGNAPAIGETFNVLTADSIHGNPTIHSAFDDSLIFGSNKVTGSIPETPDGSVQNAGGSILQLIFLGHARPGDATRDQTIDSADFAVLATHYGQTRNAGWAEGDFNGDGTVNALDFNALALNYGKGGTFESPIGGDLPELAMPVGANVPEPISVIFLGICGLLGRRNRQ